MGDVNAGDIVARVKVEYDPSGAEKAKDDLKSLSEITGGLGESTGAAGDGLAALDEQLGKNAESAKSFNTAIGELPKIVESGTSAVSDMTDVIAEQQGVIADTAQSLTDMQEPLKSYNESLQAVSDTMSKGNLTENMSAFQDALQNPYPFSMIGQYLNETGQTWGDFTSSIGDSNVQMLHEMANNADVTHQVLGGMASDAQNMNKTFTESAGSAAAFTEQFNGMTEAVGKANEGINAFGGAGNVLAGPLEELKSIQPIGFGEAFGNASEGIMGALNDIAMPLMAVQMIAMAVGAVGSAIYNAAAIAEGPAAHSFGSFTGTVDALGQQAAKSGAQFSEAFGQGVLPSLNAMNNEVSQGQPGWQQFGNVLGGITGVALDLFQIGTGTDVVGGFKGLANTGASLLGVQQPFQGPGPAQQQQIQYEQTIANMPTIVQGQVGQMKTQSATILADSITPAYLQAQDDLSASQMIYQRVQASYNASHPVNQYQMLQRAQETAYDNQQNALYNQQTQGQGLFSGYDFGGFWGGVGGGIGNIFSGMKASFASLFGLGTGDSTGIFSPSEPFLQGGGCFPAGTRVLMADGSEKPIETLQIGEQVSAHNGTQQVTTAVVALIKPPPRWVYTLTFSDGNTLTLTASHPIATPLQGWKSLSPSATKKENPKLAVSMLEVGDSVCTVYGECTLVSIQPREIVQVYNIEVAEPHTFYANGVLVHNKMGSMTNSGVGSEDVSISHTFTATVNWAANNLEKEFTGTASWVAQGLANTFEGVANWIGQNLENMFTGNASWIGQNLENMFTGVANWTGQNLIQPFTAMATWIGEALEHLFTGNASWIGENLEHTFTATANWIGQGLNQTFTAVANFIQGFASGVENFGGGLAVVGEAGPELVMLPGGSSVYPMSSTGGGATIPALNSGGGSGSAPQSINLTVQLDSQAILSAIGLPLSQNIRLASGMRAF